MKVPFAGLVPGYDLEPFVTVEQLEAYTRREWDDAQAELVLAAACSAIRDYCEWHITPSITQALVLDGPGGWLLLLPSLYLTAVSEVTDLTSGTEYGTAISGYEWSKTGQLVNYAGWPKGLRSVRAVITHGYPKAPASLVAVALSVAVRDSGPDGTGPKPGISSEKVGGLAISYSDSAGSSDGAGQAGTITLSDAEKTVLDRYALNPTT